MGIFDWLSKKQKKSEDVLMPTEEQLIDDAVEEKTSSGAQEETLEITGEWLNQVWKEKPVQVYANTAAAMDFLSQSELPHLWSDVQGYIDKVNNEDDPQRELRVVWTASYLNHPKAEVVTKTLQNHVTSELLNSWMVAGWLPYLIIHSDSNVRHEAAKALWKCKEETTIQSVFGVFSGKYLGLATGPQKFAAKGKFQQSAESIVKNLREQCPPERKEFFEELVFEVFRPSLAERKKPKAAGEVKFKEREVKTGPMGIKQTYEVHTASSKEDALAFLEKKKVEAQHYYIIVETPEGNWGKDCMGVFEE